MNRSSNRHGYFFTWFGLTAVYIVGGLLSKGMTPAEAIVRQVVFAFGLFVPYGIWNTGWTLLYMLQGGVTNALIVLLPFSLLVLSFLLVDKTLERLHTTSWSKRLVAYLLILSVLTFITDFVLWREWTSWNNFTGALDPYSTTRTI